MIIRRAVLCAALALAFAAGALGYDRPSLPHTNLSRPPFVRGLAPPLATPRPVPSGALAPPPYGTPPPVVLR